MTKVITVPERIKNYLDANGFIFNEKQIAYEKRIMKDDINPIPNVYLTFDLITYISLVRIEQGTFLTFADMLVINNAIEQLRADIDDLRLHF